MFKDMIIKNQEGTHIEKRRNTSVTKRNDSIVAVLNTHLEVEEAVNSRSRTERRMAVVYELHFCCCVGSDPERGFGSPAGYWVGLGREPDIGIAS